MERKSCSWISLINNNDNGCLVWLISFVPGPVLYALQASHTIEARTPWGGDYFCSHFTEEENETCGVIESVQDHSGRKWQASHPYVMMKPMLSTPGSIVLGLFFVFVVLLDKSWVISPLSCKQGSSHQGGFGRSASRNHGVSFFFWLYWVFVAAHGLSLVAASGGYSLLWSASFSLQWLLLLWSTGSRCRLQ